MARLTVPTGHKDFAAKCYFTPNDHYLVSVDEDKALCIWDGNDGRQLLGIRDSAGNFGTVCFDKYSNHFATVTDSGRLYIIDFQTLGVIKQIENVNVIAFSPAGKELYFSNRGKGLFKYSLLTNKITVILKDVACSNLYCYNDNFLVAQDGKGNIIKINSSLRTSTILVSTVSKPRLLDVDLNGARLLYSAQSGKENGTTVFCYDLAKNIKAGSISLGKNINALSAAFTANRDNILACYRISDEATFTVDIIEPALYSLRNGKKGNELGAPFYYDLGELNLNLPRTALVFKPDESKPYKDFFIRYDLLNENRSFFSYKEKENYSLTFACANTSNKIAVFDKHLLLPVILADGKNPDRNTTAITKYPGLKLGLKRSASDSGLLKITGLLKDELAINDSILISIPEFPEDTDGRFHCYIIKNGGKGNVYTFDGEKVSKPYANCTGIYWEKNNWLYCFHLGRFMVTDSLDLGSIKNFSTLRQLNDEPVIVKDSSNDKGLLAIKYDFTRNQMIDTVIEAEEDALERPYIEAGFSHESLGLPSYAKMRDRDLTHGTIWEYPWRYRESFDTVEVVDTTGNFKLTVVQSLPYLHFRRTNDPEDSLIILSEQINYGIVEEVRYWKDDKYLIMTRDRGILIFSLNDKKVEKVIPCRVEYWNTRLFVLPNGQILVTDKNWNDTYVFTEPFTEPPYHLTGFYDPSIQQADKFLALQDATFGNYYIYSRAGFTKLCTITLFSRTDYVVHTYKGLFDGTEKALDNLYFLVSDSADKEHSWKTVDMKQLKARYYIPGLFEKLINGDRKDLPDVETFHTVSLAPDVKADSSWSLEKPFNFSVQDKGGGIGAVRLILNGKEIFSDLRPYGSTNKEGLNFSIDLKPYLKYLNGKNNDLRIITANRDSSLSSRGVIVSSRDSSIERANPKFFVISIGTSDYKGSEIDLQYSSKDANDISAALKIGGSRLFGADSTFIYTISSISIDSNYQPTKKNIDRIFQEVARLSTSKDLVLVYLSGHGISVGNDFYYLTKDAWSANASTYVYKDLLVAVSVSSSEFTEYLKKIAALKQLFIIDACASGKVVENLIAHRDIPVSTLKALDRMKDRTGTHVITGCAADAVSYEASRFGQGLLTYSLLEGMKGASLRENRFLDVSQWFQYARDRVPQLANGLGGIQTPQVCSPQNNESFDIAELDDKEKLAVPLARERPVFIKSIFQEEDQFTDILSVGKATDNVLHQSETRGVANNFLFIPVDDFPGSYQVLGRYKWNGTAITATIRVIETTSKKLIRSITLTSGSADSLANAISEKIRDLQ